MSRDTVVVVPCFNEAARLVASAFVDFVDTNPFAAVLFVDDGSTDATLHVLSTLAAERPDALRLHALERNCGKAEAVRIGVNEALATAARYVAYWDADLSTPLSEVAAFRELMETDPALLLVGGSRIRRLGANVRRDATRHYLGRVFGTLASLVLGIAVYDTQCGAKLLRAGPAATRIFDRPFLSRWVFDVEVFARLIHGLGGDRRAAEAALYEYPLAAWQDVGGSKLRPAHMVTAFFDLLRIRRAYRNVPTQASPAPLPF